jgi:hypothetical protein
VCFAGDEPLSADAGATATAQARPVSPASTLCKGSSVARQPSSSTSTTTWNTRAPAGSDSEARIVTGLMLWLPVGMGRFAVTSPARRRDADAQSRSELLEVLVTSDSQECGPRAAPFRTAPTRSRWGTRKHVAATEAGHLQRLQHARRREAAGGLGVMSGRRKRAACWHFAAIADAKPVTGPIPAGGTYSCRACPEKVLICRPARAAVDKHRTTAAT